jgi:hypothetical protein
VRLFLLALCCMKKGVLLLSLIFVSSWAFSQQWKKTRREVILGVGASNFLGDLGGADQIGTHLMKDLEWSLTRPQASAGFRYKLSPNMAVKSAFTWCRVAGNDQLTLEKARLNRNLSFRSDVYEFSAVYEYSIIEEKLRGRYSRRSRKFPVNIYVFGGISAFYFNPKAQYNNAWVALKPLGTEGQGLPDGGKEYSLFQVAIPLGIGFKYPINKEFSIGLEYCMRKTFTDYMDDVSTNYYDPEAIRAVRGDVAAFLSNPSTNEVIPGGTNPGQQRGNPNYDDSFLTAQIYVAYKLTGTSKSRVKF